MSKPVVKILLVHGWFLQAGLRINFNPVNGLPFVYHGDGFWMYHGSLWFRTETTFEGILYDHCGIANVLNGTMVEGKLQFDKAYTHRQDVIRYELSYDTSRSGLIFNGDYKGSVVGIGKTRLGLTDQSRDFFQ